MKKILPILLTIFILVLQSVTAFASQYVTARLDTADLLIDGYPVTLIAYNIDGNNYFKIRDICNPLNYDIQWDNTLNAVWIDTTSNYQHSQENNLDKMMITVNVALEDTPVFINGLDKKISSCTIDGFKYFKLRDIAELSKQAVANEYNSGKPYFCVSWDNTAQKIVITTTTDKSLTTVESEEWIRPYSQEEYQQEIVKLVNEERAKVGVDPVQLDPLLMDIAMLKATEMWELGYYSHTSPVYGSPSEFAKNYGYSNGVAENITLNGLMPETVMKMWLNSEGHRRNILNPDYKYIGAGFCGNENQTKHVQMFSY